MVAVFLLGVGVLLVYVAAGSDLLDYIFKGEAAGLKPPSPPQDRPNTDPNDQTASNRPAAPGGNQGPVMPPRNGGPNL